MILWTAALEPLSSFGSPIKLLLTSCKAVSTTCDVLSTTKNEQIVKQKSIRDYRRRNTLLGPWSGHSSLIPKSEAFPLPQKTRIQQPKVHLLPQYRVSVHPWFPSLTKCSLQKKCLRWNLHSSILSERVLKKTCLEIMRLISWIHQPGQNIDQPSGSDKHLGLTWGQQSIRGWSAAIVGCKLHMLWNAIQRKTTASSGPEVHHLYFFFHHTTLHSWPHVTEELACGSTLAAHSSLQQAEQGIGWSQVCCCLSWCVCQYKSTK